MATTTLQLTLLMLLTDSCLATWQSVTLMKGSTLTLSCPLDHGSSAEWQNPHGIMFYNDHKGIKDRRFKIEKLSATTFEISVSDITFKDGGDYKCTQYGNVVTEKVFSVTVIGQVEIFKINRKSAKCSAGANLHPPQISWQMGDGIIVDAQPHYTYENHTRKYTSESMLSFQALKGDRLCCIVQHQHLKTYKPVGNCIEVRPTSKRNRPKTTTWSPKEPQGSTDLRSMTTWPEKDQSTSPEATTLEATASNTASMNQSQEPTDSWRGTIPETVVSTGMTSSTDVAHVPVTESTDMNITEDTYHNSKEGNITKSNLEEMEKQSGEKIHGSLLIFLVTCLIVALSVVVLFLAIKLRRAHIHWKRENEDSDQSIESNKSKSSDEERWWMGQKCRGIFNIAFTKYATEEPTGVSVTTPVAMPTKVNLQPVEASPSHFSPHDDAPAPVKETEL